jgi:hypothetical protein
LADVIDEANDRAQANLDKALAKVPKPTATPIGIGICLNCGEGVDGDGRWCCPECRDEWDHRQQRKQFNA